MHLIKCSGFKGIKFIFEFECCARLFPYQSSDYLFSTILSFFLSVNTFLFWNSIIYKLSIENSSKNEMSNFNVDYYVGSFLYQKPIHQKSVTKLLKHFEIPLDNLVSVSLWEEIFCLCLVFFFQYTRLWDALVLINWKNECVFFSGVNTFSV